MEYAPSGRHPGLPALSRPEWRRQLRTTGPILLAACLLTLAAFLIVSVLHFQDRVSAYQLIDDPAPFAGVAPYTGLLSHAGVVLWCVAATVCGFGGAVLRNGRGEGELSRFLLALAGLNAWLAIDDLLVLHEEAAEALLGFESRHVGEALILLGYAVIQRTDVLLLLAAAVNFGVSIALDFVLQLEMGGNNIFLEAVISRSWGGPVVDISEELLKLNGILLWTAYLVRVAYAGIRDAMGLGGMGATERQSSRSASTKKRRSRRF